jgi:hypothetical protein
MAGTEMSVARPGRVQHFGWSCHPDVTATSSRYVFLSCLLVYPILRSGFWPHHQRVNLKPQNARETQQSPFTKSKNFGEKSGFKEENNASTVGECTEK